MMFSSACTPSTRTTTVGSLGRSSSACSSIWVATKGTNLAQTTPKQTKLEPVTSQMRLSEGRSQLYLPSGIILYKRFTDLRRGVWGLGFGVWGLGFGVWGL